MGINTASKLPDIHEQAAGQPKSHGEQLGREVVAHRSRVAESLNNKGAQTKKKEATANEHEKGPLEDPAIKAVKEKYRTGYLEAHQAELTKHLEELIKSYKSNDRPEEQAKKAVAFEATLDYCIRNGKSTVEAVMRAIILGVEKGIIRHEHLSYYQRYADIFPPLVFLINMDQKEFKKLANDFQDKRGNEKFMDFYWTEIIKDPKVTGQIRKSASAGKWDHDMIASIAPGGNGDVARSISVKPMSSTAVENAFAGALKWLRVNLNRSAVKKTPHHIRNILGWFLVSHGYTATNRLPQNVKSKQGGRFLLNDQTRQEVPRMSEYLLGKRINTGQINESIWTLIRPLEPTLFRLLEKPDLRFEELRNYLQAKYKFNINSFDNFYDNIESILKQIFPDPKKGFFMTR